MKITVDQLLERVMSKLDDVESIDTDDVIMAFNRCAHDLASDIDIRQLATVTDVTVLAGDNTVALPDDYNKNLTRAHNKTTNLPVKVYESRRIMDRETGNENNEGNITSITEEFPNVYCKGTPAASQVVSIYYHRIPDDILEGGDFPSWIPIGYVYDLFYNFAVADLYDYDEDGIEGEKVNTLFHSDKYEKTAEKFKLFIGPDPDGPYVPDKDFNFEDTQ